MTSSLRRFEELGVELPGATSGGSTDKPLNAVALLPRDASYKSRPDDQVGQQGLSFSNSLPLHSRGSRYCHLPFH